MFPKDNDLNFESFSPPADYPLCFPKENVQIFCNLPPAADFPLCSPKEMFKFSEISASGGFSFVFPKGK